MSEDARDPAQKSRSKREEPNVWWRWLSFGAVVAGMNSVGTIWLAALMFLVCTDIILRYVFNSPIDGVTEIVEISIVSIVYLQLAYALKSGRLTRSDAVFNAILNRVPVLGNLLGILFNLIGAALALLIVYGSWPQMLAAYKNQHYVGNVGVFTFPEWPSWLLVSIGSGVVAIQFVLLSWEHLMTFFGRRPTSIPAGGKGDTDVRI